MRTLSQSFLKLVAIMDELREKCPWDRKQTIQSLRHMTIEETYELADAITEEDWKNLCEELGDLLLHILFYAKIGTEQKQFTLEDVIRGISEKLISRHPHIYGNVEVKNEEEVKKNWEKLKLKEGKVSVLSGVPVSLPAMVKAMRLQEKARQVGFEWENPDQVWEKVEEEMRELKSAVRCLQAETEPDRKTTSYHQMEEEMGDVLFSLVNYARYLQVDPENALEKTNKKFIRRFTLMEEKAAREGKNLAALTLEEMDELWNTIKHQE